MTTLQRCINVYGLNYRILGEMTGINEKSIARYAKGETRPNIDDAYKIACILNVNILYLWDLK